MSEPKVSVCIPTRDRAAWLAEALESVFAQTLQDFEIVVCDDASTDDTLEVVADRADPRLHYLRHERPLGIAANRNACLQAARGRYVAWLDSDDRYLPRMLETQCAALDRRPRAAMAHGAFHVIDAAGRRLPDWPRAFDADVVEPGLEAFRELTLRCYVSAPTVVVRRAVHQAVGPYRATLPVAEDWEMWMRICLYGDLAFTAEPVAEYRWHGGSATRRAEAGGSRLALELDALRGVFAGHRPRIPEVAACERRAYAAFAARAFRRATDCLTRGRRGAALSALGLAVRACPRLSRRASTWSSIAAVVSGAEYRWHLASRAALARLGGELEDSRAGAALRRASEVSAAWEAALHEMARTVRRIVPPDAALAVVDKWDPTLLHLSRRRGWHFPDRRLLPDGYPPDSATAVRHLEAMRRRGAEYLVVPSTAFWWLEHYPGLTEYLHERGAIAGADRHCAIFRLTAAEEARWAA